MILREISKRELRGNNFSWKNTCRINTKNWPLFFKSYKKTKFSAKNQKSKTKTESSDLRIAMVVYFSCSTSEKKYYGTKNTMRIWLADSFDLNFTPYIWLRDRYLHNLQKISKISILLLIISKFLVIL